MIAIKKKLQRLHNVIFIRTRYPHVSSSARIDESTRIYNKENLVMEANTNIDHGAVIMNTRARFVMKKNSGAAFGLTVITGGHLSVVGKLFKSITNKDKDLLDTNHKEDLDVTIDEDVWIGARSTLLRGTHVGRGSVIGAGTVIRGNVPPYSIVIGNPAKVVGFKFTPEEVCEHEKILYKETERIPLEVLRKNYEKFFLNKIHDIKLFIKL